MLQYSPKIVQDGLVMCLDPSQNKSYPAMDLPVKDGLALWLDASDDTTFSYSSGTSVSQWRDKSGNNRHFFQATAGNQPSRSAVVNSRKAIQFTASSGQYLRYNSTIINNRTGGSVFVVWRTAGETNSYSQILDNYHGGANVQYAGFSIERNGVTDQYYWGFQDTGFTPAGNIGSTAYSNNTTYCYWITKDSTTITGGYNGTSVTPVPSPSSTWTEDTKGWLIGSWGSNTDTFSRFFNGIQCEIIIFNRGLSTIEVKQVNTYLGQKWGISNTDRSTLNLAAGGFTNPWLLGNGTTVDMPQYSSYNKSFSFDGITDIITYPNALGTFSSYTFSFWARRNAESKMALSSYGNSTFYWFGDNSWAYTHGGVFGEKYYNKTVSIPLGSYGHYCVTYDGATVKIYRNGVFEDSQASTGAAVFNVGLQLGKNGSSVDYMFSGDIANFLMYSRALSATEVAQNYESQKARFASYIVTNGLALNLDAGNPFSYAGAGTTWYDVSGNNYNGILTNGPVYNTTNGGVIVFDGSNDYVVSSNFTPNFSTKTLSGWVKLSSISQQGGGLITLQSIDGLVFDSIVYNETGQGWGFGSNGFSRTGWSNVLETSTSEWVNITATYENSNYRLYRNGTLIQTLTSFGALNFNFNSNVQLGYRHLGSSGYLAATISQGFVYNRALSAAEVLQNYNATKGRFGL